MFRRKYQSQKLKCKNIIIGNIIFSRRKYFILKKQIVKIKLESSKVRNPKATYKNELHAQFVEYLHTNVRVGVGKVEKDHTGIIARI